MTIDLDIFINVSSNIDAIRNIVDRLVGHPLSRVERDTHITFKTRALCIDWVLYENNGLEDDNGIEFTKYEYQLSLLTLNAGPDLTTYDLMYEGAAFFMAYRLSLELECHTLVVRNLAKKVAAYSSGRVENIESGSRGTVLERR